jgi:hypothetical protein
MSCILIVNFPFFWVDLSDDRAIDKDIYYLWLTILNTGHSTVYLQGMVEQYRPPSWFLLSYGAGDPPHFKYRSKSTFHHPIHELLGVVLHTYNTNTGVDESRGSRVGSEPGLTRP